MSACYYDMGGVMVGFMDLHPYIALPITTIPKNPHIVGMVFRNPARLGETDTVTSEGKKMATQGFSVFLIPQNPYPVSAPDPEEPLMLAVLFLTSKTTAYLSRSTVTHGGTPLACCVASMVGVNGNCGLGGGWVINPNSVVTSPSAGDFAGAIVARALDLGLGEVIGGALDKVPGLNHLTKPLVGFILGETVVSWFLGPVIDSVRKSVQETVDDLL